MTLGGFVRDVTSGVYAQVSYHGTGADRRQSELLKKVLSAFTSLRTEFEAYKASLAVPLALGGGRPTHEQFARMFAAKLQPALFTAAALAQSELDQATAALATATAEASSAGEALKALKARKGVPKPEKDAATARKSTADRTRKEVAATVKQRKGALELRSAQRETFYGTIAWILDRTAEPEKRAAMSVGGLCNVITFFLYGKAVGVIPPETDFQDYYLAEVKAARIRYHKGDEHEGVLWGEGSELWAEQRDLERYEDPDLKLDRRARADPMTHESRRAELDAFLKSGANVALTHQDLKEPPSGKPHHFLFIVKVDGVWRNIDHTSSSFLRRGSITDWNRVYRIEVDASLMRAVQSPPASVGAAGGRHAARVAIVVLAVRGAGWETARASCRNLAEAVSSGRSPPPRSRPRARGWRPAPWVLPRRSSPCSGRSEIAGWARSRGSIVAMRPCARLRARQPAAAPPPPSSNCRRSSSAGRCAHVRPRRAPRTGRRRSPSSTASRHGSSRSCRPPTGWPWRVPSPMNSRPERATA